MHRNCKHKPNVPLPFLSISWNRFLSCCALTDGMLNATANMEVCLNPANCEDRLRFSERFNAYAVLSEISEVPPSVEIVKSLF